MKHDAKALELGPLSIQWLEADPGPCGCGREIGIGLVGFRAEPPGPVCDVCCLDLHRDVGMAIWMIHAARLMAEQATGTGDPIHADRCMITLLKFAQIYHQGSTWPPRRAAVLELMDELRTRLTNIADQAMPTLRHRAPTLKATSK